MSFIPSTRLVTWLQHVGQQAVVTLNALLFSRRSPSILLLSCLTQSQILPSSFSHLSFLVLSSGLSSSSAMLFVSPSSIIPRLNICFGHSHTVANFSLFTATPNTHQCSTHSPHCGQLTHAHEHTHSHPYTHQQSSNVLVRDLRPALKTNTDLSV